VLAIQCHAPVFADEPQFFGGSSTLTFIRRADLAARCVALIRLWPNLPSDGPDAADCAALAVSSLEQGVLWSQPQHLIQAPQALSLAALRKAMCAPPRQRSPSVCAARFLVSAALLREPLGRPVAKSTGNTSTKHVGQCKNLPFDAGFCFAALASGSSRVCSACCWKA